MRPARVGNSSGAISGAVSGAISKARALEKPTAPTIAQRTAPPNPRILDDERGGGGATITTTETARSKKPAIALGTFVVLSLVAAVIAWQVIANAPRAEVAITSEPTGATVRFDGKPVAGCETPCTLPPVSAGTYSLLLAKVGFEDLRTRIDVPASGKLELPPFKLQEERRAAIEPVAPLDGGLAPPAVLVAYTFKSSPSGALLTLDGKSKGLTPVTVQLAEGLPVQVVLKSFGYHDLTDTLVIFAAGDRSYTLEKLGAPKLHHQALGHGSMRHVQARADPVRRPAAARRRLRVHLHQPRLPRAQAAGGGEAERAGADRGQLSGMKNGRADLLHAAVRLQSFLAKGYLPFFFSSSSMIVLNCSIGCAPTS